MHIFYGLVLSFSLASIVYGQDTWTITSEMQHTIETAVKTEDITLLKKVGSQIDSRAKRTGTWKAIFAEYGNNLQVLKFLHEKVGVDINQQGLEGQTALHTACEAGAAESIEYLINKGAHVNRVHKRRLYGTLLEMTPLDYAIRNGTCAACIDILLKHEAKVSTIEPVIHLCKTVTCSPEVCKAAKPLLTKEAQNTVQEHLQKDQFRFCWTSWPFSCFNSTVCNTIKEKLVILNTDNSPINQK
ncbi:MAG TPA: ankyrin repeat domain-containing protein [Candidatus Babeliales bacterium]|jgi:hypothetical protein|nr:ankyrin repeat domain-containing protein [Candidatus Babeliales bacterium]